MNIVQTYSSLRILWLTGVEVKYTPWVSLYEDRTPLRSTFFRIVLGLLLLYVLIPFTQKNGSVFLVGQKISVMGSVSPIGVRFPLRIAENDRTNTLYNPLEVGAVLESGSCSCRKQHKKMAKKTDPFFWVRKSVLWGV
jgi:hypothetical protein